NIVLVPNRSHAACVGEREQIMVSIVSEAGRVVFAITKGNEISRGVIAIIHRMAGRVGDRYDPALDIALEEDALAAGMDQAIMGTLIVFPFGSVTLCRPSFSSMT